MKPFNDNDFLLMNDFGKQLYHQAVASLPIIDPHNHIDTAALAANKQFENIYQLWVQNDPYKHRAMRIYGIAENLITGNAPDYEKFLAWASCFPSTMGNPLYHWTCMELKKLFDIDEILSPQTALSIWNKANNIITTKQLGALDIMKQFGAELLCTSDDLVDTLEHHTALAAQQTSVTCLPSLRSDSMLSFDKNWLLKLQQTTGIAINTLHDYKEAIIHQLNFFHKAGCLLSDHSFDSGFTYVLCDASIANILFEKVLHQHSLTNAETVQLQSHLLHFLGKEYASRKWIMQLHIGAYRYTSSVLRNKVGPAGGYACIGSSVHVPSLCSFLDDLDKENALPKTILYTLNPADNAVFASITGSYAQDGVQAKIQFGPAWWYNDHYEGIHQQLLALSSYGLLSTAIGFTTDSRSIVSFVRHDYYRRILCNLLGQWVTEGKLPNNFDVMCNMAKNIAYYNIKSWIKNDSINE